MDINDETVIANYAEIDHYSDSIGIKMGKNDAWIAATAKASGYTLMTMDKDFDHLAGVHIELIYLDAESHQSP